MNNLLRFTSKLNRFRSVLNPVQKVITQNGVQQLQQRQIARNLVYLCNHQNDKLSRQLCGCGCGSRHHVHSKGEVFAAQRELVEFLTEEILTERKAQKSKTLPTELAGFQVQLKGADVTLTKKNDDETIKISFNVNHSVDSEVEPNVQNNMDKPEFGELKSRPSFKVEIIRGKTTFSLLCSFLGANEQEDGYNDIFGLDEISIYDGDWDENVYAVSGEVLDSYLHDLILNYLEEKGISNEFCEKLSEYSTMYEHSAYIGLLEGLSKFASGK